MTNVTRLPEINPWERAERRPMTLVDHAHAAGLSHVIVIGRNPMGEMHIQFDAGLKSDTALMMIEKAKHALIDGSEE